MRKREKKKTSKENHDTSLYKLQIDLGWGKGGQIWCHVNWRVAALAVIPQPGWLVLKYVPWRGGFCL